MKPKILFAKMILLSAGLGLLGCAAMQGLPQDSMLTGDYEGPFDGKFFWGSIEIKVYETPGGARLVFGRLNQEAQQGFIDFRGEIKDSRLEAQFTFADGTVSGELSADGKSMTGTYRLTDPPFDQGTWSAQKR
jgi:hypothetical protein